MRRIHWTFVLRKAAAWSLLATTAAIIGSGIVAWWPSGWPLLLIKISLGVTALLAFLGGLKWAWKEI